MSKIRTNMNRRLPIILCRYGDIAHEHLLLILCAMSCFTSALVPEEPFRN